MGIKNLKLVKAENAVMAHDWKTAAKLYKDLLVGDEANEEYLKALANIYVRSGEDEKAIPYFEQLITFNPHDTDSMNSLGAIYRRLKRFEDSIAVLQKAKNEKKSLGMVNYNLGFTYKEMGNYEDAIDAFETVISANPNDVLAYNHLGSIYYATKDYNKSINIFRKGLQVDPNHPILNYNLARCFEAVKNTADAIHCYQNALKTRPGWIDAIRDFSNLLINCQETQQAQDIVEQSIKLHPLDTELLCLLGKIYLTQNDYENSATTYRKADGIKSGDTEILTGLAKALEKSDRVEQALGKVEEAVDIEPENKEIRKQYAHTLLSAQRYDQALDNINELYNDKGDTDPQILDLFGQYFICRGNEEVAKFYYDKIKKLNHHYKDYILEAADRFVQTGDYYSAEKYAKDYIAQRPHKADGYTHLGKVYAAQGKLKNAKEEFEKSVSLTKPNVFVNKEINRIDDEILKNPEKYNEESLEPSVDPNKTFKTDAELENEIEETEENPIVEIPEDDFDFEQMGGDEATEEILSEDDDEDFWNNFDDESGEAQKNELIEDPLVGEPEEDQEVLPDELYPQDPILPPENMPMEDALVEPEPEFEEKEKEPIEVEASLPEEPIMPQVEEPIAPPPTPEPIMPPVPEPEPEVIPEPSPVIPPAMPVPEPEPKPEPKPEPIKEEPNYQLPSDELLNRLDSMEEALKEHKAELEDTDKTIKTAFDLDQMAKDLAEKQQAFQDELRRENQQMIQETVDKTVDEKLKDVVEIISDDKFPDDEELFEDINAINNAEDNLDDIMDGFEKDFDDEDLIVDNDDSVSDEKENEEACEIEEESLDAENVESEDVIESELDNEESTKLSEEDVEESNEEVSSEITMEDEEIDSSNSNEAVEIDEELFKKVDEIIDENADIEDTEITLTEDDNGEIASEENSDAIEAEAGLEAIDEEEGESEASENEGEDAEVLFLTVDEIIGGDTDLILERTETVADEVPLGTVEIIGEDSELECRDEGELKEEVQLIDEEDSLITVVDNDGVQELKVQSVLDEENLQSAIDILNTDGPIEEERKDTDNTNILNKIEKILSDPVKEKENIGEIELFKKLRVLSDYLPDTEKNSFASCKTRVLIEYLISKMSGKPGLLLTTESLLKSGALGPEYESQLFNSDPAPVSDSLVVDVLLTMKELANGLEDKELHNSLDVNIDSLLEQIELHEQNKKIF